VETRPFLRPWHQCSFWSFPYYLMGSGIAGLMSYSSQYVGWRTSLLVLPITYLIYLHYRLYLERQMAQDHVKF
jgi:hypothetical protein